MRNEGRDWSETLKAIAASILFGILGAIVAPLLPTAPQQPQVVAAVTAVICIALSVIYFLFAHARQHTGHITELGDRLAAIEKQLGVPAELIFERFDRSTGEYHRKLQQLINETKPGDTVLILSYHNRPAGHWLSPGHTPYLAARQSYFDTLISKAQQGVTYRRILTFENLDRGEAVRTALVREHTLKHCRDIATLSEESDLDVAVRKAPAVVMADVLIINDDVGAISMETYAEKEKVFTAGAFIVQNPPHGRILQQLKTWWTAAERNSESVLLSELTAVQDDTSGT